jgi:hypothetical protein
MPTSGAIKQHNRGRGRRWLEAIELGIREFNVEGRGDMVRFTAAAAMALAWTAFSAGCGYATPASAARPPPAASAALITDCYRKAEWIVPRMRGRSAWVVRHADHCVRGGGSL